MTNKERTIIHKIFLNGSGADVDLSNYFTKAEINALLNDIDGVDLPIAAQDVTYNGQNLDSVLDALFFVDLNIDSFSISPSNVLVGSTVSSVSANYTFSKQPNSAKLVIGGIDYPINLSGASGNINQSIPNQTSNFTVQLSGTDSVGTKTSSRSVNFLNRRYYGVATLPGTINSSFVTSLTAQLSESRNSTRTLSAGAGEYYWFAFPVTSGSVSFNVGGFDTTFVQSTVSVTNSAGFTEDYNVYRSPNPNQGTITITTS